MIDADQVVHVLIVGGEIEPVENGGAPGPVKETWKSFLANAAPVVKEPEEKTLSRSWLTRLEPT